MITVTVAVPVRALAVLSRERDRVCAHGERRRRERRPRSDLTVSLLVHTSERSGERAVLRITPVPAKLTDAPCANDELLVGAVISATGGWLNGGGAFASADTSDSENVWKLRLPA